MTARDLGDARRSAPAHEPSLNETVRLTVAAYRLPSHLSDTNEEDPE